MSGQTLTGKTGPPTITIAGTGGIRTPGISIGRRFHLLFQAFRPETMMVSESADELRRGRHNSIVSCCC